MNLSGRLCQIFKFTDKRDNSCYPKAYPEKYYDPSKN